MAAPPRRKRSVFRVVVIALVAFIMVGGVIGYVAYDRATAIDRSTPVVVTGAFLRAVFVDRDPNRVALFICPNWSGEQAMSAAQRLVDPVATTTWDTFTVLSENDRQATVRVRVRARYEGEVAPSGQDYWQVDLVNVGGWRVCAVAIGH